MATIPKRPILLTIAEEVKPATMLGRGAGFEGALR
jgi:hypothetical protein